MPENNGKDEGWSTVIEPPRRKLTLGIKELWLYKYLVFLFIKRDFTTAYKQTILGPLWFIIQPIMTAGIYTIIFSGIAKIPTDGIPAPLFYLCGQTIWTFFQNILTSNAGILGANSGLFGKVYFPRLAVPLATSVSKLYQFIVQFILLLIVFFFYLIIGAPVKPNLWLLAMPFAMFQLFILGLGFGLWASAWTVKYRDLTQLIGFGMGLWMWATPIAYPVSFVTNDFLKIVMEINPASASIELFRLGFTGIGTINPWALLYGFGFSMLVFIIGLTLFNKAERTYVDVV